MNAGEKLKQIREAGLFRSTRGASPRGSRVSIGGREFFNFASNDYLGISSRKDFQEEFLESVLPEASRKNFLMGSTSSRLLGGTSIFHEDFEAWMAQIYSEARRRENGGAEECSCLMFNGGFGANSGILPVVAGKGDLIVCDKLVHASSIDGARMSEADFKRYPHSDLSALRRILERDRPKYRDVWIVSESVFSMDGDLSDLRGLSALAREFGAKLYIDEAHSFGLYGEGGLGLCARDGVLGNVDVLLCTLGKAAGSCGAFAICSREFRDLLVNECRPFIFSTALPPINAMWTKFAVSKILKMDSERENLRLVFEKFAVGLEESGVKYGGSAIVPMVIGSSENASEVSKRLFAAGIFAPAIRPPTVPPNSSRIRFSLNADFSLEDVSESLGLISGALEGLEWKF